MGDLEKISGVLVRMTGRSCWGTLMGQLQLKMCKALLKRHKANIQIINRLMELLGKTNVDHIDLVTMLSNAHQEVIWLDVMMYEVARVDILNLINLSQRVSEE